MVFRYDNVCFLNAFLTFIAPPMPSVIVRSNGEVIDAVTFNVTDEIRYMGWYHFVGLIWTTEFVFACHRMVVAGAVATWYFKRYVSYLHFSIKRQLVTV